MVLVPGVGWEREEVALLPADLDAVDDCRAPALERMVERDAGVAMRQRLHAWPQHLDPAAQRREHVPTRHRVRVLERDVVERAGIDTREIVEGPLGLLPRERQQ